MLIVVISGWKGFTCLLFSGLCWFVFGFSGFLVFFCKLHVRDLNKAVTYSIFKGRDRLEGQDESCSSWSQSGGRWWTPKARQWAAGRRENSDRLESLQGQGTNEAGDWVHKGVKQQIITVQCSKKSHLLWGLKNKEESARWRGGEDHWSQKCGSSYWTCLPVAFPSQTADRLTKSEWTFSKGGESTTPSRNPEHLKSEWIHPSWLKQSPRGCCPRLLCRTGYSLLSASFTPEWRTPGNPASAKHSTVSISRK